MHRSENFGPKLKPNKIKHLVEGRPVTIITLSTYRTIYKPKVNNIIVIMMILFSAILLFNKIGYRD